ncbi:NAD(P)-binding protein [Setomelanomma holmii]|uniref:NAD(P)-binding protein n=1 Tax=Setomelanomma holmii TaxID=210430 RepID=A0A9P4H258_9PLEO|nr:NAD(P)-binding protein [Setomelanomma holmii]
MSAAAEKQIILITGIGATNGIGLDTTIFLVADSPNNHVIMGARSVNKAEAKMKEIQAKNPKGTLSYVQLDVNDDESSLEAVKKIKEDFGRLDVLVNNAGICPENTPPPEKPQGTPQLWASRKDMRDTFETNVYGVMVLTEAAIPLLKTSKNPMVINVTSGLGSIEALNPSLDPSNSLYSYKDVRGPAYRMSKAALNMMTTYQYAQLRGDGFKIWAYCPGYVVSDLTNDREAREQMQWCESSETSAQGILDIVHGERDADAGKFITKRGGIYPW